MSLAHSPGISTNGLVCYYDMSNTKKSWKGAPTTNLLSNPTAEVIGTTSEFVQYRDIAPIFNTNGLVPYSLSLDLKAKVPGNMLVYMQNGSSTKYSFVSQTVSVTTEYQRFTFNNLTPAISNAGDTAATLAFYGTYGSGRIPSIKNVQIELGSIATPFVNGTRSNTQALVDLTGNNTITTNSLTYASDNTFSFNAANTNYLTIPFNAALFTFNNEQTIIIWMKNNAPSSARRNPYNMAYGGAGTITHETGYNFNYYYGTAGINSTPYTAHGSPFTVVVGETAMIAITRNITQTAWYKNGILGNTQANPYGATVSTGTSDITIGSGYAGSFGGNIYNVQIYNRALSAAEVLQNFNALRGRYGL